MILFNSHGRCDVFGALMFFNNHVMNSLKFIGIWTSGLVAESSELRQKIEIAFNAMTKEKDDWFYKVEVDGKNYFVADNGEFGYTAMLPEEY